MIVLGGATSQGEKLVPMLMRGHFSYRAYYQRCQPCGIIPSKVICKGLSAFRKALGQMSDLLALAPPNQS